MKDNRFLLVIALIVAAFAILPSAVDACTAFQLTAKDGSKIYFRSMEFGLPFHSQAVVIPRGTPYTGTAPDGKPGLKWVTRYGVVGLNTDLDSGIVADGMNEKGLVVGMLYLPGYASFLPPDAGKTDRTIGDWELPTYLLSTVATVGEARQALQEEKAYVAQQIFPALKQLLPVHYYIADSTGAVIIAEYVNGRLSLHDDSLGILTNSPPFDWQTTNLANYVNLSPVNVPSLDIGGTEIQNFGQGSGMLGIPGDSTPPSRFVRAALLSHWVTPGTTALDTVNAGFHVLNTFDIFEGAVRNHDAPAKTASPSADGTAGEGDAGDITEWAVAHDRTNLKTYVRTYKGLTIQMIDLKNIDFALLGLRQITLDKTFSPADITRTATVLGVQ